ncbi:hypothetical protein BKD30_04660 [Tersicoccus phoenicis]|uniref:Uncharacterized protein n=1 Tax=Tersicoccus phoenicis TaxID=554083 RepID=A0A1R1LGQ4_9MICC|nr:hypothetical protein BKD30_04660 [Tersicoccus phoenicis]
MARSSQVAGRVHRAAPRHHGRALSRRPVRAPLVTTAVGRYDPLTGNLDVEGTGRPRGMR